MVDDPPPAPGYDVPYDRAVTSNNPSPVSTDDKNVPVYYEVVYDNTKPTETTDQTPYSPGMKKFVTEEKLWLNEII